MEQRTWKSIVRNLSRKSWPLLVKIPRTKKQTTTYQEWDAYWIAQASPRKCFRWVKYTCFNTLIEHKYNPCGLCAARKRLAA